MSDTRNFLHYWRLSPDGRLVFGGRTSFAPVTVQTARDRLYAAMIEHLSAARRRAGEPCVDGQCRIHVRPAAAPHAVGRRHLRDGVLRQWRRAGQLDGNARRRVDRQGCPAGLFRISAFRGSRCTGGTPGSSHSSVCITRCSIGSKRWNPTEADRRRLLRPPGPLALPPPTDAMSRPFVQDVRHRLLLEESRSRCHRREDHQRYPEEDRDEDRQARAPVRRLAERQRVGHDHDIRDQQKVNAAEKRQHACEDEPARRS